MTPKDFRRIALGLEGAVEGAHMEHPDFRADGRIFATIHPDHLSAMVKLSPDQQEKFVQDHPKIFTPENGAWGRGGCTRVRLDAADEETVGEAMTFAWQEAAKQKAKGIRLRSPEYPGELRRDGSPKQRSCEGGQKAKRTRQKAKGNAT